MVRRIAFLLLALGLLHPAAAYELRTIALPEDGTSVDVRVFPAQGAKLLLGFACDEGSSVAEEATAASLAQDGIEVWMPDMLSAYMLPRTHSSIAQIPTAAIETMLAAALETGKQIFLVASGPDTDLILRSAAHWEAGHKQKDQLSGALLLFPRLYAGTPQPGKTPEYVAPVGTTRLPILVLEGERTPNRWGLNQLTAALEKAGSPVHTRLIPNVRGYFFTREDPNASEEVVTLQLAGLIKASLFYLGNMQ